MTSFLIGILKNEEKLGGAERNTLSVKILIVYKVRQTDGQTKKPY